MANTPNFNWPLPTVGGDADAWGTILNTAIGDVDGDLHNVSLAQQADAANATALTARVTTLEGQAPGGLANWSSGKYFFGATCEGLERELVELAANRTYLVPFLHQGGFNQFLIEGAGSGSVVCTAAVYTTTSSGTVGALLASATGAFGGVSNVSSITLSVGINKPAWLAFTPTANFDLYARGTTGVPPRWVLGTASATPTAASDIVPNVYGATYPYTAGPGTTLGTKGWAPSMALRSA